MRFQSVSFAVIMLLAILSSCSGKDYIEDLAMPTASRDITSEFIARSGYTPIQLGLMDICNIPYDNPPRKFYEQSIVFTDDRGWLPIVKHFDDEFTKKEIPLVDGEGIRELEELLDSDPQSAANTRSYVDKENGLIVVLYDQTRWEEFARRSNRAMPADSTEFKLVIIRMPGK